MPTEKSFYRPHFRQSELADLSHLLGKGLADEIDLLRVFMRRTLELADGLDDLGQAVKALTALSNAATRLSALLEKQERLASQRSEFAQALQQAIAELTQELNLEQ